MLPAVLPVSIPGCLLGGSGRGALGAALARALARALAPPSLEFFSSELLYRLWFFGSHDVPAAAAALTAAILPTQGNMRRAQQLQRTADALTEANERLRPWTQNEWRFEQKELVRLFSVFFFFLVFYLLLGVLLLVVLLLILDLL